MIFNLINGGPVITVTYPAGSTCTCTKGTTILEAEDKTGRVMFAIPEAGTWTVACTDGTNSDSAEQSVSKDGVYTIVLSYEEPIDPPTTGGIYAYGGYGAFNYLDSGLDPIIGNSATWSDLTPGTYDVFWVPQPNTGVKYANVTVVAGQTTSVDMRTGSSTPGGDTPEPSPTPGGTYGTVVLSNARGLSGYYGLDDGTGREAISGSTATFSNVLPGTYACSFIGMASVLSGIVTVVAGETTRYTFS